MSDKTCKHRDGYGSTVFIQAQCIECGKDFIDEIKKKIIKKAREDERRKLLKKLNKYKNRTILWDELEELKKEMKI